MDRILTANLNDFVNQIVLIQGWVDARRDHGKIIFIDLRDKSGKVQVVFDSSNPEMYVLASKIRPEWVVSITGAVHARPEKLINYNSPTGKIEIDATNIKIISQAETLPFDISRDTREVGEEVRLKYRYLDLRSERMQKNIRKRHEGAMFIREYLTREGFVEIETPMLTKTSPEGARDFLVPARLHPGHFYALPQSPQQYKQLLMVAGFERYFQFARCFRDEDSRADRAFGEFTQLDIEMSFVSQEDIMQLTEKMFTEMVEKLFPEKYISAKPWPRVSHKEAVEKHGSDKPDLRKNKEDVNELAFSWTIDFPLFTAQSENDYYHGSGSAKFAPSHHMFTSPHPDDIPLLDTNPMAVRGLQYDLILNGFEVGGGSIRIYQADVQQKIFDLIGFSEEQKKQFDHMLTAFTYGVPPHGGIAPGIDRLFMALLGEPSLREMMAFPKTGDGRDLMMDAPSPANEKQLAELSIEIKKKNVSSNKT